MQHREIDLENLSYEDIYYIQRKHILDLRKSVVNPNEETLALWSLEDQTQDSLLEYYRKQDRLKEAEKKEKEEKESNIPSNLIIKSEVKVK